MSKNIYEPGFSNADNELLSEIPAAANASHQHRLTFLEPRLTAETASLAAGIPAVCSFVNEHVAKSCACCDAPRRDSDSR